MFRKLLCVVCAVAVSGCGNERPTTVVGAASALSYTLSAARPEGGFGPVFQPYRGVHWTFFGLAILRTAGAPIPNRVETASFLREQPAGAMLSESYSERALALHMLGLVPDDSTVSGLRATQEPDGGWNGSIGATYRAIELLTAMGAKPVSPEKAAQFFVDRLTQDGFFREIPRPGTRSDSLRVATFRNDSTSEGSFLLWTEHIWNTYCAVQSLTKLGYEVPWRPRVRAWLQSCQNPDGGFSFRPASQVTQSSDVWYTWLAIDALRALGAVPADSLGAVAFVNACQNADGGFGDRPGRRSRLESTYYAIAALNSLCGGVEAGIKEKVCVQQPLNRHDGDRDYSVNYAYVPSADPLPGFRSLRGRGLPLSAMGDEIVWTDSVPGERAIGATDRVQVSGLVETFPRSVIVQLPGNVRAGCRVSFRIGAEQKSLLMGLLRNSESEWAAAAGQPGIPWGMFLERYMTPFITQGALPVLQIGPGDQAGIYALTEAVGTGLSNDVAVAAALDDGTDLVRACPRIERLNGLVPFVVALSGVPREENARTLWLGNKSDSGGFFEALRNGRAVCAVRTGDSPTGVVFYGDPGAIAFAAAHPQTWAWWDMPAYLRTTHSSVR
ncbi:MAG TPA: terpene cyclase/mutase family protein [Candidatus Latescibacteria bacterium]|nr:terpene cyclase/mutase family protein [Candidatus Latescibacterota bacterium]